MTAAISESLEPLIDRSFIFAAEICYYLIWISNEQLDKSTASNDGDLIVNYHKLAVNIDLVVVFRLVLFCSKFLKS